MKPQFNDDEFAGSAHAITDDIESRRFWRAVGELPTFAQSNSERSDLFWSRQRAQIWKSIEARSSRRPPRSLALAWMAAATVVALAAMLLSVVPVPVKPQAQVDPDHELLLDIERSLNTGGPQALEPATLLVEEISQNTQSNPASSGDTEERTR